MRKLISRFGLAVAAVGFTIVLFTSGGTEETGFLIAGIGVMIGSLLWVTSLPSRARQGFRGPSQTTEWTRKTLRLIAGPPR